MHIFLFRALSISQRELYPACFQWSFCHLKAEFYLNKATTLKKRRKDKHCDFAPHTHTPRIHTAAYYELKSHSGHRSRGHGRTEASLGTLSDSKAILFLSHVPGSSMWTMIQLKATSAPIFPVKYTAFRHASRGKPISASCITDDSSMSDAAEHNRAFWCKKVNPLLVSASLHPLLPMPSKESAVLFGVQMRVQLCFVLL